jgi:C_GCAxxG_C_C family probable redox protein
MERQEVEQRAFDYFQAGFLCAEAVSKTIVELFGREPSHEIPRVASGFGGGFGGTRDEACGALSGGLIALGYLFGRMTPSEDYRAIFELVAEYRRRFMERFGSSTCRTLLEGFGEQDNWAKCKRMSAEATGILWEMLKEKGKEKDSPVPGYDS